MRDAALTFLRGEDEGAERVTYVELFFDLVFAFAITQISGVLGEHPNALALFEAAVICFAVWWVWVYTAWATNWLDPERRPVLWVLLALTAFGLVLSEAIPQAFEDRAAVFVAAYLGYGFTRTLAVIAATRRTAPDIADGQRRILAWSAAAGVFWIAGVFVDQTGLRLLVWGLATVIEYSGPWALFWLPGRGRSSWSAWRIRGGHFSERAALFIIIVLGESILVIGRGLSVQPVTPPVAIAALTAFVSAVAMWFLYFAHGQDRGRRYIAGQDTSGPFARLSYTYLHVVLVIGLVLSTHGSDLALELPGEPTDLITQVLLLAGPALYLAGLLAFKLSIGVPVRWIPWHRAGTALLLAIFGLSAVGVIGPTRLDAALLSATVLVLVVIGDEIGWLRREAQTASP
jgi:low temperature requirement protein LtrA